MSIKHNAHDDNEVVDGQNHQDPGNCVVTFFHSLNPATSKEFTSSLQGLVQKAHAEPTSWGKAQKFEEGDVSLFVPQFKDFPPNVYLMDFYDINDKGVCSRMHIHTGLRFVFIYTGPDSVVNVSSFSPLVLQNCETDQTKDKMPGLDRDRYNYVMPPNSLVSVQIPTMQSHQFNAIGPHAAILSVHIEEALELNREGIPESHMMRQTIFCEEEKPALDKCALAEQALLSVVAAPAESKVDNIIEAAANFTSRFKKEITTYAACASLMATGLGFGYNRLTADAREFAKGDVVTLHVENQPDMDAYIDGSTTADNPGKIYLPRKVYELYTKNPELLKDPALLKWIGQADLKYATASSVIDVPPEKIEHLLKYLDRVDHVEITPQKKGRG